VLRERRPPLVPKFQPRVIQYSNPDCRINPDPDSRCLPGLSQNVLDSYLVSISHFAKFCKSRPVTVWEMLINLLKSTIPQWWGKWKIDLESVSGTGAPPKVDQLFQLVGPTIASCTQKDTDRQEEQSHAPCCRR